MNQRLRQAVSPAFAGTRGAAEIDDVSVSYGLETLTILFAAPSLIGNRVPGAICMWLPKVGGLSRAHCRLVA